jgi:hypothetical protein
VFVASWQIACCWEPPAVGDLIAWHLVFVEEPDTDEQLRRGSVQLDVKATLYGEKDEPFEGHWALQLDAPLLSLYWLAPRRALGPQRLAGYVHEDHHAEVPETFPATYGIVRRIQVQQRTFVRSEPGSKTWTPSPVPPVYRDVTVSPKWFRSGPHAGEETSSETGILVEIEAVAPTPGPEKAAMSATG